MAGLLLWSVSALAGTIAGVTYQYNPPLVAGGNGEWTWNADLNAQDVAQTKLTDGVPGSLAKPPFSSVYNNGTWAVYGITSGSNKAAIGHPRVDFDLGGIRQVSTVEVQYLIDAGPGVFPPEPGDLNEDTIIDVDALTVYGSTDGVNYTSLGASNSFQPVFGPGGLFGTGAEDARTTVFDFGPGGVAASHIRIDVRTPFTWIGLGEVTISEVPEPATAILLSVGLLGGVVALKRRRR